MIASFSIEPQLICEPIAGYHEAEGYLVTLTVFRLVFCFTIAWMR